MDTSKVGFYISVYMGLTFNIETLNKLFEYYKIFKNSVVLIYDISKSNYGLNPIQVYRISEKALETFDKNFLATGVFSEGATVGGKVSLV
jgi:hypothetical protein